MIINALNVVVCSIAKHARQQRVQHKLYKKLSDYTLKRFKDISNGVSPMTTTRGTKMINEICAPQNSARQYSLTALNSLPPTGT